MSETRDQSDPAHTAGSDSSWSVDPGQAERIDRTVAEYVDTVAALDPGGQRYLRTVATIDRLGQREFTTAAALSTRMLDRRLESTRGLLAARAPLAHHLAELRKIVDELNPAQLDIGRRRSRGPFGMGQPRDPLDELADYFEHFAHSQGRVEEILAGLAQGHLALERDNALIGQEQISLATVMETLREQADLTGRLDAALAARIDAVAEKDPERAECLRADLLHAIRRRRQELLTQLAVSAQGYASLQIVHESNQGMIRALASATTTTAAALRTAVMAAQAVAGQRMAQEQIEAAGNAAEALANDAGRLAERQSAAMKGGAARVATLRREWDEVFAALDQVDAQKDQALRSISTADRAGSKGSTEDE